MLKATVDSLLLTWESQIFKTDNGPAYVSRCFCQFFQDFEINPKTGITYNPQGQAIVEHAQHTLKAYLVKVKKENFEGHLGSANSITCFLS